MAEPTAWQTVIDVAILHPVHATCLVHSQADGYHLPQVYIDGAWHAPLEAIRTALRARYGLETVVLQQLAAVRDDNASTTIFLYLLTAVVDSWQPPADLLWVDRTALDRINFSQPAHRVALAERLAERETGVIPALRVPWARPGWQPHAEAWISTQLARQGYSVTGPIEQIKSWFLSCILRAPTQQGAIYFKVMNPTELMVDEAIATGALAQLFPDQMPTVLAVEPTAGWLLLADFGPEVGWSATVETRVAVLQRYGELQVAAAAKVEGLAAMGFSDRRLPILAGQVDELLGDEAMLAYVDPAQRRALQAAAPTLKAMCAALAQHRVPATLVHGDLHMANVAQTERGYCFFDWSDGCIAHPFLDMITILHERDQAVQSQLRDCYLAVWVDYEPMERLLAMWELAYPLCALHQAVSYRAILYNTEPSCRYELDWAMPFWFGEILKARQSTLATATADQ